MIEPTVVPLRGYTGIMPKHAKLLMNRIVEKDGTAATSLDETPAELVDSSKDTSTILKRDLAIIYGQTVGTHHLIAPDAGSAPVTIVTDPRENSTLPATHVLRAVEYPAPPKPSPPDVAYVSGYCGHRPGTADIVGVSSVTVMHRNTTKGEVQTG